MNQELNDMDDDAMANNPAGQEASPENKPDSANDNPQSGDDYYDVDRSKSDVISTIGDGEMHDEGLVGTGDVPADTQSSTERLADEQDAAELHDSEG